MSQPWSIKAVLEWTEQHFAAKGAQNPRLEAQWIICAATDLSRIELYTNYDLPLGTDQLAAVRSGIKRRLAGEPLQYITGKAAFRHLELTVRAPILIPRPETEILVDVVLKELKKACGDISGERNEKNRADNESGDRRGSNAPLRGLRVLDIGTGSGAIALSLLRECEDVSVVATDKDLGAIALAQENAQALGFGDTESLQIIEDDLAISFVMDATQRASFDVIVSNPPYIPTAKLEGLPSEVARFESKLALDGGADGLVVFRTIVEQSKQLLKPGGLLACELHEARLEAAKEYCESQGFAKVAIHLDLTNRPRIISARKML